MMLLAFFSSGLLCTATSAITPEDALRAAVKRKQQALAAQKSPPVTRKPAEKKAESRSSKTVSASVKPKSKPRIQKASATGKQASAVRKAPVQTRPKSKHVQEQPPVAATLWP